MMAHAPLYNRSAEARYIRFSVRWTKKPFSRAIPDRTPLSVVSRITPISAIDVAIVRDRPLPNAKLPLELPKWIDAWY